MKGLYIGEVFNLFTRSKQRRGKAAPLDTVDPRTLEAHCLVAGNLHIRGDVFFSGNLRIDGRVDGNIQIYDGGKGNLILSKGAVVQGDVRVDNLVVDGLLHGNAAVANKLECRAHGTLRGKVIYKEMTTVSGAKIEAKCEQSDKPMLTVVSSNVRNSKPQLLAKSF